MGTILGLTDAEAELIIQALICYEDPSDEYAISEEMHELAERVKNAIGSIKPRKRSDE